MKICEESTANANVSFVVIDWEEGKGKNMQSTKGRAAYFVPNLLTIKSTSALDTCAANEMTKTTDCILYHKEDEKGLSIRNKIKQVLRNSI